MFRALNDVMATCTRKSIKPFAWIKKHKRLFAIVVGLPSIAAMIFIVAVAVQARVNKELFINQAAETLRSIIGQRNASHLEYSIFVTRDKIRHFFHHGCGRFDPRVADRIARPLVEHPAREVRSDRPPDIEPLLQWPVMPNEGHWTPIKAETPGLWHTRVRVKADDELDSVNLVAIDPVRLRLTFVPGMELTKRAELSRIPTAAIDSLAAVFNGGFRNHQEDTGQRKNGIEYHPLMADKASVIITEAGVRICKWDKVTSATSPTADVRQNFDLLLDKGEYRSTYLQTQHLDFPTYRTGLGITADQRWLIFAGGNRLTPKELAVALRLGCCATAVHLDQNHGNVFFDIVLKSHGTLRFSGIDPLFHKYKIAKCLTGSNRDFFFISAAAKSF